MTAPAPRAARLTKRHVAAVVLRVVVLAVAVVALCHQLAGLNRAQVADAFRAYKKSPIALAALCTAASFAILGFVELLAMRYAGPGAGAIPRRAAFATSFVAHAFSQSIGFGLLTGAAVRLRAYPKYNADADTCARMSIFVSGTTLLGLFSLGSIAVLTTPGFARLGWTRIAGNAIGATMAVIVLAYVAWCSLGGKGGIGLGRWRLTPPSPSIASAQMLLAIADWFVAAIVLYTLLPHGTFTPFAGFLAAYLVAHAAGIASHVPAGTGVFEATFIALMTPHSATLERAGLVASLVAYRVLYYALPLCVAAALAMLSELSRPRIVSHLNS